MGTFANFREVIKELKHTKRGEATTNLCPMCGSPKIALNPGSDVYPQMIGITPIKYVCPECGYSGPLVLEQTKEKEETG